MRNLKQLNKTILKPSHIIMTIIPIILVVSMAIYLYRNNVYNSTERVASLSSDMLVDGQYNFGEISIKISDRGGDSGSWMKDPIYDDEGNMLHGSFVGTIYEAVIYNNGKNVVSDWTLRIPINEPMWLNNNWNSKMEVHQDVNGDEKVLAIDLSDYSDYDINLDYYLDHTGPMIPLYVGDYFIYLPEEIAEEKPIKPSATGEIGEACARFGYIMYIPDKGVDYIADFSGGELRYYLYADPLASVTFWIIFALMWIWFVTLIVMVVTHYRMRSLIKQQQLQKQHDEMMVEQTMKLIINMIENKDVNTKGHSIRVAEYSRMIADKLGMDEEECQTIYYIGLLHDCGKVNIPDSILKNPGRLSDEEFAIMKKHTTYGGEILKDFTSIPGIDIGAKYHHERYDGRGYPTGLSGEEIPLIARIIGVADAFDAMNSNRCYRNRLSREYIISELENNSGKQFDANIVECLLKLIKEKNLIE